MQMYNFDFIDRTKAKLVETRNQMLPSLRAALPAAIAAGVSIGLLTDLFSLIAPLLIGGMSGFGFVATVFGALVWLNLSYQILLFGAAWARVRRDREALRAAPSG